MANDEHEGEGQSGGVNISGGDVKWKGIKTDGDLIDGVPSNGIAERHPSGVAEKKTTRPERDDSKKLKMTYDEFTAERKALGRQAREMKEFIDETGKKWRYGIMNIDFTEFAFGPDSPDYIANYDLVDAEAGDKPVVPKSKTMVVKDLGGTGQVVNLNNSDIVVKTDIVGRRKIVR